ncbi:hypothetical protein [Rosistilla oblonga]|uniref:hypothetical protein n=1 Tax=Rosistilla oblonga TaxID=2527990 RepID=UPI0018D243B4|nr:hypothetical protein [Rosistilla oblonga]
MIADPKPKKTVVGLDVERTEVSPNTSRSVAADLLEMNGRMIRVSLEESKVLVGLRSDGGWKPLVALPK